MTDKLSYLNNVRRTASIFENLRINTASGWLSLGLFAVSLVGCSDRLPTPQRDELVQLLGELGEDVVVLGAEVQERVSRSFDAVSLNPTQDKSTKSTKLWVVRSKNALPTPKANDQPLSSSDRASKPNVQVNVSKNAFPARVLYDIATSLQIEEADLPSPPAGTFTSDQGSLSEWSKSPWGIRIRDYQTPTGWLSVVEAFEETVD